MTIFADEVMGKGIAEQCPEQAQHETADRKGNGIRHHLLVDRGKAHVVPIENRGFRSPEKQRTGPIGRAENRDDGPGVIDPCTGQQGQEVEAECPRAQTDENGVEPVKWAKGNPDSNGEG